MSNTVYVVQVNGKTIYSGPNKTQASDKLHSTPGATAYRIVNGQVLDF